MELVCEWCPDRPLTLFTQVKKLNARIVLLRRFLEDLTLRLGGLHQCLSPLPPLDAVFEREISHILIWITATIQNAGEDIEVYNERNRAQGSFMAANRAKKLHNKLVARERDVCTLLAFLDPVLQVGLHFRLINKLDPMHEKTTDVSRMLSGLSTDGSLECVRTQIQKLHSNLGQAAGTLACIQQHVAQIHQHHFTFHQVPVHARACVPFQAHKLTSPDRKSPQVLS